MCAPLRVAVCFHRQLTHCAHRRAAISGLCKPHAPATPRNATRHCCPPAASPTPPGFCAQVPTLPDWLTGAVTTAIATYTTGLARARSTYALPVRTRRPRCAPPSLAQLRLRDAELADCTVQRLRRSTRCWTLFGNSSILSWSFPPSFAPARLKAKESGGVRESAKTRKVL